MQSDRRRAPGARASPEAGVQTRPTPSVVGGGLGRASASSCGVPGRSRHWGQARGMPRARLRGARRGAPSQAAARGRTPPRPSQSGRGSGPSGKPGSGGRPPPPCAGERREAGRRGRPCVRGAFGGGARPGPDRPGPDRPDPTRRAAGRASGRAGGRRATRASLPSLRPRMRQHRLCSSTLGDLWSGAAMPAPAPGRRSDGAAKAPPTQQAPRASRPAPRFRLPASGVRLPRKSRPARPPDRPAPAAGGAAAADELGDGRTGAERAPRSGAAGKAERNRRAAQCWPRVSARRLAPTPESAAGKTRGTRQRDVVGRRPPVPTNVASPRPRRMNEAERTPETPRRCRQRSGVHLARAALGRTDRDWIGPPSQERRLISERMARSDP